MSNLCPNAGVLQRIDALYTNLANSSSADYRSYEELEMKLIANTPLHEAAAAGETLLAMEIATLKPSFARKLNEDGLSPMHLALKNHHNETVRSLLTIDRELVRVKGKLRMTVLHCAAEMNESEILAQFLLHCPFAIEDLSSSCESALHIAVKRASVEACQVILGWLQKVQIADLARVVNWKDDEGNSVLHIATYTNQPQVLRLFIPYVSVYSKNLQGQSSLDLLYLPGHHLDEEVKSILLNGRRLFRKNIKELSSAEYLSRGISTRLRIKISQIDKIFGKALPMELRNVYLVVSGLIVTATYQAILSPPGGYWQDNSVAAAATTNTTDALEITAGKMIMSGLGQHIFLVGNTAAFYFSMMFIIYLVLRLPKSLFLISPSFCLIITYVIALQSNTEPSDFVVGIGGVFFPSLLLFLQYLFLIWPRYLKPETVRGQITK